MSDTERTTEHRAAVFGAAGYTGALASELLWSHPGFELAAVTSRREQGRRLSDLYPSSDIPLPLEDPDAVVEDLADRELEVGVVAYPHREAAELVAELRSRGVDVVDLSADFRLHDLATYEEWYGEHGTPELLANGGAVYGLPERYREEIRQAELVANPGCYPTATLLALAPLAREGLIADVTVEAYSGISGAGRGGAEQFRSNPGQVIAYGEDGHQHQPEIEQELAVLGYAGAVEFRPHVVTDVFQGLKVECAVRLARPLGGPELGELYRDTYAAEPFVEVVQAPIEIEYAKRTNLCRIATLVADDGEGVIVHAVIDNLWKGASGQAVQNLNLMCGLPETTGLA